MSRLFPKKLWPLMVLAAIYLVLTFAFSRVMHFSRALDEGYHLELATFIKQQGRLPVNYEERIEMARADLPPLYHVLVALVSAPVTVEEQPNFKYYWDSFRYRVVDHQLDQPWTFETEDFQPPYLGRFLVWQIGRWLSIGLSLAAVLVIYGTLQEIPVGYGPTPSIAGAAMIAFIPRYLILGSAFNDDSLLALAAACYFWMLVKLVKQPHRWLPVILVGAALGLSLTVKYSLILMPLQLVVVIGVLAYRLQMGWLWAVKRLVVMGVVTLLFSGWWFGWNIWYFNTIAQDGFLIGVLRALLSGGYNATLNQLGNTLSGGEISAAVPAATASPATILEWAVVTFQSFWGHAVNNKIPFSGVAFSLIAAGLAAGGAGLWRLWRSNTQARPWLWLTGFHVALLLIIPIIRFETSGRIGQTAQGRHILIPAATAVAALLVWGLAAIIPRRWHRAAFSAIVVLLIGWTAGHLVQIVTSGPQPLPMRATAQAAGWLSNQVNTGFGDALELTSYSLAAQPEQGRLNLELAWRSVAAVNENYLLQVRLLNSAGHTVSYWQGYNGQGRLPTLAWDPGDSVFDRLILPLPNLPAGQYRVQVQLVGRGGPLPVNNADALLLPPVHLAQNSRLEFPFKFPNGQSFAVWSAAGPVIESNFTFRYPGTITLITADNPAQIQLINKAGEVWPAENLAPHMYTAVIGPRWAGGDYSLQVIPMVGQPAQTATQPVAVHNWWPRQFNPPPVETPLKANFADQLYLLGYKLSQPQVKAGQAFPITLYWQAPPNAAPQANFIQFNTLLDSAGAVYGGYERRPLEYYSTLLWAPGEVVVDGYTVPVNANAPPGQYYLNVGFYLTVGEAAVNLPLVQNGQMTNVTSVTIGPVEVVQP